ncbi:hypothetical protein [Shewanella sp. NIFS-20-20]|uniref:hypothetical protein n=1 Tax=Shewanella sp. NIFS-20-20 TaxID=2853806 RepID=UPI001C47F78F|nr:hypothetical protein [Shewanella sp. NIFS-20-20]MBV7314392.1 hypothetical protein [Shewanella sp. NIFS-20-20]
MKQTLAFLLTSLLSISMICAMLIIGLITLGASMFAGLFMSLIEWLTGSDNRQDNDRQHPDSPVL